MFQGTSNTLLLLLKSVEVYNDVALLLSCAVLGSMCTQVTLQTKLGGTGSAAVKTRWPLVVRVTPQSQCDGNEKEVENYRGHDTALLHSNILHS